MKITYYWTKTLIRLKPVNYFNALTFSNPFLCLFVSSTCFFIGHYHRFCTNKQVEIVWVQKVLSSPTCAKCKFGIQIPNGIKNTIYLNVKNENILCQDAIRTELKQLSDYQTFILLYSGEDIPKGYQKILYHIVFDVKYDLRHEARLVVGGNWMVNDILKT
jgi:glutaredoxin-related protein